MDSHETWFADLENVRELIWFLVAEDEVQTIDEVLAVLEKPWKWSDEYRALRTGQSLDVLRSASSL